MARPEDAGDLGDLIAEAAARVRHVRNVGTVRLGTEVDSGRPLVTLRVGLPPGMPLTEVVAVVARVQLAAARLAPRGSAVFVEPDVAADQATPTEAIVIRGAE